MKNMKLFTLVVLMATFVACNDDDKHEKVLAEKEIPAAIIDYKTTHFPEAIINRAILDSEHETIYEIYLSGNVELDFNENCEIIDIDGTTKLPDSVIPVEIQNYVTENYPTYVITDWELELGNQQIEFSNGWELEFKLDGTFIRIDKD
ncbi:MAG: PepSY-like domain-containing protein [Mangrovibacterium sp.]